MPICKSCGASVPKGKEQKLCSMCYGDLSYGSDGYHQWMLEEQAADEERRRFEDERLQREHDR